MAMRRLVTIEQLPEITSEDQGRRFLGKIRERMSDRRPGLVLDCSGLSQLDTPVLQLLLSCLEDHYGNLESCVVDPDRAVAALRNVQAELEKVRDLL